ncbi:MAG: hypothetical protein JWM92_129 [Candidatus Nomurabacteria bacterium]|nr:hypothetical protein [Candidatus Nomurabacteria bacterium]
MVVFFAVVAFAIYHKANNVAATCFDRKQNQSEAGIDCGGPCNNYCAYQLSDPIVEWVRVFPVTPGIVDAVAYVKNNYPTAAAQNVSYDFKLYDASNNVVADRTGSTFLGPAGETAIVETLIPIANSTVALTRFSFTDPIAWQKISPTFLQTVINTDRNHTENFDGGTRLTATLENDSRLNFLNTDTVALFYDKDGNVITASKVLVPALPALQSKVVYFTWPYPVNNIVRTQIIPRINPFTAQPL